jgi:hypothetical protein
MKTNAAKTLEVDGMSRYQCHKQVWAFKITNIKEGVLWCDNGVMKPVSQEWLNKHKPKIGGYYVIYGDGYTSYSPAKAFEDGYTLMEDVDVLRPGDTIPIKRGEDIEYAKERELANVPDRAYSQHELIVKDIQALRSEINSVENLYCKIIGSDDEYPEKGAGVSAECSMSEFLAKAPGELREEVNRLRGAIENIHSALYN